MGTKTASVLIDLARLRHWSFTPGVMPDGALLLELNQRMSYLALRYQDALLPLLGTTAADVPPDGDGHFPLPASYIALGPLRGVWSDASTVGVDLVAQREELRQPQTRNLQAYVLGGLLVPVRFQLVPSVTDGWTNVTALRVTYTPVPVFASLSATSTWPDQLAEALVAHLASLMALASAKCTSTEKAAFVAAGEAAERACAGLGATILGDDQEHHVEYRE